MKKSSIILLATALLVAIWAFSASDIDFSKDDEGGIQFKRGTWKEALTMAKKENKLIFVDIYATWCGPCKKLKKYTFADKKVGDFYNANFINVAIDGEEGEGVTLAQKYGVRAYPSLFFIDGNGEVVLSENGYHNDKELIKLGEKALKK